jgi:dienelactone hydrolase
MQPFYKNINHHTTKITACHDLADVYFPESSEGEPIKLPIALMLQGVFVDKVNYSNFASQVASYGFIVVVPNHERAGMGSNGQDLSGLLPEQEQVNDVLAQMRTENSDPTSPLFKSVETNTLGLLGHSFGGAVALGATQEDICVPQFCSTRYSRPPELKAIFAYGAAFGNPQTQEYLPIKNEGVAIGLILGSLDSISPPVITQATYSYILNPPKVLITVAGANHYSITNTDNVEREFNRATLDQATATRTIARWSGLFLRSHLFHDRDAFDYIYNTGSNLDSNVSVIREIPI